MTDWNDWSSLESDLDSVPVKNSKTVEVPVMTTVHPFETQGLGKAPYRFMHTDEGECACDYCGTRIRYLYHILSTDGKRSIVGSECIKKAQDTGLMRVVKIHEKARRQARKAKKLEKEVESWKSRHPDQWAWLEENRGKNSFAASLCASLERYGSLTERQMDSIKIGDADIEQENWEKFSQNYPQEAKFLESDASDFAQSLKDHVRRIGSLTPNMLDAVRSSVKRASEQSEIDSISFNRVIELFNTAKEKLKKPRIRIGGMMLSLAPAHGVNAGHIYLKSGDTYLGKITPQGRLLATRALLRDDEIKGNLKGLNEDPLAQAVAYGRETGACACCGRELTDKKSVEMGIGPICAIKWGLA